MQDNRYGLSVKDQVFNILQKIISGRDRLLHLTNLSLKWKNSICRTRFFQRKKTVEAESILDLHSFQIVITHQIVAIDAVR